MLLWLAAAAVLAGLFVPVYLTADLHHGTRRLLRLRMEILTFRQEWLTEAVCDGGRHGLIIHRKGVAPRSVDAGSLRGKSADRMRRILHGSRRARKFLMAHTHAVQIDAQLLLHTPSAAATALLTGAVHTALRLIPSQWRRVSRIRILPDFLRDRSTLQARCIFRLCMGTLLITAGLLLTDLAAQVINREAHSIWNTPSEN